MLACILPGPVGLRSDLCCDLCVARGINAGILNPITILVYNNASTRATAPLALEPQCQDDDTDLRLLVDGIDLFSVRSLPATEVTCMDLKEITQGEICTAENISGVPTLELARVVCPGSCTNLCDAAGFGLNDTASARLNRTVSCHLHVIVERHRYQLTDMLSGHRF
eukprot:COSAG02_NODE_352_length_24036_cov_20.479258_25_plen_167_part_00